MLSLGNTRMQKGFTLIELLIVIAIIGILMGIVLVAVNPGRQTALANNATRISNVSEVLSAIGQYMAEHHGQIPPSLLSTTTNADIAGNSAGIIGSVDLCNDLVPTYMSGLPSDPSPTSGSVDANHGTNGSVITNCQTAYATGYYVTVSTASGATRITVTAPYAELGQTISVTR